MTPIPPAPPASVQTAQHHFNLANLLSALAHIAQVAAAVTPLVVGPLTAAGKIDAADSALANSEAAAAGQILAAITPQTDPAKL